MSVAQSRRWIEDITDNWEFKRIIPAHFAAPVPATPRDLRCSRLASTSYECYRLLSYAWHSSLLGEEVEKHHRDETLDRSQGSCLHCTKSLWLMSAGV